MLKAALFSLTLFALCRAQAPAPDASKKATIEGHVTSLTGEPLRKVTLRLQGTFAAPPDPGVVFQPPPQLTAETDAQGNFVFRDIDPGRYNLNAERSGYVREPYGARGPGQPGTPLNLSAGQSMTGVTLKMTPQAVISGKILDEDGDPMPNARVQAMRLAWTNGRRQMQPAGAASAGPDGSFAIGGLTAGRYFVNANDPQSNSLVNLQRPAGSQGPEQSYITTYYPGVTETSAAVPIEVGPGAEMRGMDIRMRKGAVYRIRGKVVINGTPPSSMNLLLLPTSSTFLDVIRPTPVSRDGTFEFSRVSPGSYAIQFLQTTTRAADGTVTGGTQVGRAIVTVSNQDVNDAVLQLGPGAELSGTILTEGAQQQQQQQQPQNQQQPAPGANARPRVTVSTEGMLINTGPASSEAKDDGSFILRGLAPGIYRVAVSNLGAGGYVKSVRFGGQDVTNKQLDLSAGNGGQLDIVLSPHAADVSGAVHNSDGMPVPNVNVTLWNPGAPAEGVIDTTRNVQTDQNGAFQFKNVPPGEYRIASWEQIDPGLWMVPDFRAKFDGKANPLKLSEDSHENVQLVVIGHDAIEVEAAKIR